MKCYTVRKVLIERFSVPVSHEWLLSSYCVLHPVLGEGTVELRPPCRSLLRPCPLPPTRARRMSDTLRSYRRKSILIIRRGLCISEVTHTNTV